METIQNKLAELAARPSDINEHLINLRNHAQGCEHITEMGVRNVVSTWAWLAAGPKKLVAVDFVDCPVEEIRQAANDAGIEFEFHHRDTLDPEFDIEETDFLFIDTLHTYTQLNAELKRFGNKVRKFIAFHDTVSFAHSNEHGFESEFRGLRPAIEQFLAANPQWTLLVSYEHNNGVMVIQKTA